MAIFVYVSVFRIAIVTAYYEFALSLCFIQVHVSFLHYMSLYRIVLSIRIVANASMFF